MQTDSSANRTCNELASAVECTATVLIRISRQARIMRTAISPRFAIRIFSNIGGTVYLYGVKNLPKLYRLVVFNVNVNNLTIHFYHDFVMNIH